MSGSNGHKKAFSQAANAKSKKKLAPFSLRLTAAEKATLTRRAKGQPLGGYIKGQLFEPKHASITKTDAATMLAILRSSDLARNMACIAKAAEIGALPVTPDLTTELHDACADIRRMRVTLIQMQGMRPK